MLQKKTEKLLPGWRCTFRGPQHQLWVWEDPRGTSALVVQLSQQAAVHINLGLLGLQPGASEVWWAEFIIARPDYFDGGWEKAFNIPTKPCSTLKNHSTLLIWNESPLKERLK